MEAATRPAGRGRALGAVLFALLAACAAPHLVDGYPARTPAGLVNVVVEIPAGTSAKWEVDHEDGRLHWEREDGRPRVVRYLAYPASYGMVPRTLLSAEEGGDGDPLDVVVLGPAVERGRVVAARVIGVLRLRDGGEVDDKLVAVLPDGPFGGVRDLGELRASFPGATDILETWFTSYKGPGEVESGGFADRDEAERRLEAASEAYERSAASGG